jgi:hypothetical protein
MCLDPQAPFDTPSCQVADIRAHVQEQQKQAIQELRSERLTKWSHFNNFDPIKHQDLVQTKGQLAWVPAESPAWLASSLSPKRHVVHTPSEGSLVCSFRGFLEGALVSFVSGA